MKASNRGGGGTGSNREAVSGRAREVRPVEEEQIDKRQQMERLGVNLINGGGKVYREETKRQKRKVRMYENNGRGEESVKAAQ